MFGNHLKRFNIDEVRRKLIELFKVLDTKPEDYKLYMNDDLSMFPYVNGVLFSDSLHLKINTIFSENPIVSLFYM